MNDLNIIDKFTQTFVTYIDSGFGLLSGDVSFLTTTLVAIDVVMAGLFWALSSEDNVIGQLIRKILYVGFFALLLNNFSSLANIIFNSFASLGLKASAATITAADLMRPGFVAGTGFTASHPVLDQAGRLMAPPQPGRLRHWRAPTKKSPPPSARSRRRCPPTSRSKT